MSCFCRLTRSSNTRQFQRIQQLATEQEAYPVGALTTENRDTWADAREILLKASSSNEKALERIESAIIVIALDDAKPITREEMSRGLWIGDGQSRFFDKHQREWDHRSVSAVRWLGAKEKPCMSPSPPAAGFLTR